MNKSSGFISFFLILAILVISVSGYGFYKSRTKNPPAPVREQPISATDSANSAQIQKELKSDTSQAEGFNINLYQCLKSSQDTLLSEEITFNNDIYKKTRMDTDFLTSYYQSGRYMFSVTILNKEKSKIFFDGLLPVFSNPAIYKDGTTVREILSGEVVIYHTLKFQDKYKWGIDVKVKEDYIIRFISDNSPSTTDIPILRIFLKDWFRKGCE